MSKPIRLEAGIHKIYLMSYSCHCYINTEYRTDTEVNHPHNIDIELEISILPSSTFHLISLNLDTNPLLHFIEIHRLFSNLRGRVLRYSTNADIT